MSGREAVLFPAGTGEWRDGDACLRVLAVSVVCDGRVSPVFVAHPEHALGAAPFRGYVVEAADPLLRRGDAHEVIRALHGRSGPDRGITVTMLTLEGGVLRGEPARELPPEAAVLRAGELATGVDLALARATLAAGAAPRPAPRRRSSAGVRVLYPSADLVLDGPRIDTTALHGGIWDVELLVEHGEFVRSPVGRYAGTPLALGVAVGEDGAACRRALDLLPWALRIRGRRPEPAAHL